MPGVPGICDSCGTIYSADRSILALGGQQITFRNVSVGPCSACGGAVRIPDGVYRMIGDVIELLAGPASTYSDLRRVADLLENARRVRASPAETTAALKEVAPGLASLLVPRNAGEFWGLVAVILTVIQMLMSQPKASDAPALTPERVLELCTQARDVGVNPTPSPPPPSKRAKGARRNHPCECGSGLKAKHCNCSASKR